LSKKKEVDIPEYCPGFNTQPNHFDFEILKRKGRGVIVEREYFESREWDSLRKECD
jgi:hypothetical protein